MRLLKVFSSPVMFAAIGLLFFFPFLEVQCDRETLVEATGIELLTGKTEQVLSEQTIHAESQQPTKCRKRQRRSCSSRYAETESSYSQMESYTGCSKRRTCGTQPSYRSCRSGHQNYEYKAKLYHTERTMEEERIIDPQPLMVLIFSISLLGLSLGLFNLKEPHLLNAILGTVGLGSALYFMGTFKYDMAQSLSSQASEVQVIYGPAFFGMMTLLVLIIGLNAYLLWRTKSPIMPAGEDSDVDPWDRYTDDTPDQPLD